jgi:hypothetical protein
MTAGWGGFDNAIAVGFSAAGVSCRQSVPPRQRQLYGGIGVGTSEGWVARRAGLSFGWLPTLRV